MNVCYWDFSVSNWVAIARFQTAHGYWGIRTERGRRPYEFVSPYTDPRVAAFGHWENQCLKMLERAEDPT